MACVAVGPNHSLAANVHGELFSFGRLHTVSEDAASERYFDVAVEMPGMREQKQYGREMVDRSFTAYYSMEDKGNKNSGDSYSSANLNFGSFKSYLQRTPVLVDGIAPERVVNVAAGYGYSVAISASGKCYTWGFNDKLQLGLGHRFNQHRPQVVRALEDKICVSAACGQQHTLVLTEDGQVWSWGLGVFGQLGHGTLHDEKIPRRISDFKHPDFPEKEIKIAAIACGSHHSLALDSDGCVWSWGSSEYAQQFQSEAKYYDDWGSSERRGVSKNGQSYYYSIPRLILNGFEKKRVVSIACGNLHNIALTETGECWSWGWGVHGALGHGNKRFQLFPVTVNKLKGESIVAIAGGGKSTYAVTEAGTSSYAFDLKPYIDNAMYCDLVIEVGDKQIKAHKAVVFARCPYLLKLFNFSRRFAKGKHDVLVMPQWVDYSSFMAVIRYLYTDHVRIPAHFAPRLEAMATRMFLPRLAVVAKKLYLQDKDMNWASLRVPASTFSQDMRSSLEDDRFADLVWQLDDGSQVTSHKLLLTARCEYFGAILGSAFKEAGSSNISMHEISKDTFSLLLSYIYSNEVNVSEENFLELLLCADRFLATDMKLRVEQILEEAMQPENVCDLLLLSERASSPRLRKACVNCALLMPSFLFRFLTLITLILVQLLLLDSANCGPASPASDLRPHCSERLTFWLQRIIFVDLGSFFASEIHAPHVVGIRQL